MTMTEKPAHVEVAEQARSPSPNRGLIAAIVLLSVALVGVCAWLMYRENASDTSVDTGTQSEATSDASGEAERAEVRQLVDDYVFSRGAEDQDALAELIADDAVFYYRDLRHLPPYKDDLWEEQSGQVHDLFRDGPFRFADVVEGVPPLADTWYDTPPRLTIFGELIEFENYGGTWVATFYAQTDPTATRSTNVEHYILWIWDGDWGDGKEVVAEYRTVLGAR